MRDRAELEQRLRTIMLEIDVLVKDVAPKWIRLGHLNREARQIAEDLKDET